MILWISGVVLLGLSLAVLLPALLRRPRLQAIERDAVNLAVARDELRQLEAAHARGALDEPEFNTARADLELRLGTDLEEGGDSEAGGGDNGGRAGVIAAIVLAFLVPVTASGLYLWLGTAAPPPEAALTAQPAGNDSERLSSVAEMMTALKARLENNPEDVQGWFLLAQGHLNQGEYAQAVKALERVIQLDGESAPVLVRYADAVAMAHGGRLDGKPMDLIRRALELDPHQPQALWLAGIGAAEAGDDHQALAYWQRARAVLTRDTDIAELDHQIAAVRARLGEAAPPADTAAPTAAAAGVRVRVTLDPALAERVRPGQTLFVFARAPQGPPMPLAAVRRTAADLPLTLTLDDSLAMTPALKISGFRSVRLVARISTSGQPKESPGDLFGEIPIAAVGDGSVFELKIDRLVPSPDTPAEKAAAGVRVHVSLDPALAERVKPGQSVFVFARAPQGPPMPLAAVRRTVADLPLTLQLDDSQAMTPALKISGFRTVRLVARISASGQPTAGPGDLFGEIPVAAVGDGPTLELTIDRAVP